MAVNQCHVFVQIPIPPNWAMVMPFIDSITVSIAAETMGKFSSIPRVKRVLTLPS